MEFGSDLKILEMCVMGGILVPRIVHMLQGVHITLRPQLIITKCPQNTI